MTPPLDDDDLHSLLARGGLSGAQRDRIFDNVVGAQPSARRSRRWVGVAAGVLLPIAALVALGVSGRAPDGEGEWLVPKGTGAGATIEARCPGRKPGECRVGDRLIFELDGAKDGGFFAGYAECEGKERVWYAPTADGTLPTIAPAKGHTVVPQAARIGAEHGLGACVLHLFLLGERVDRARLSAGAVEPRARGTVRIKMMP
jgi:hypothetical protein